MRWLTLWQCNCTINHAVFAASSSMSSNPLVSMANLCLLREHDRDSALVFKDQRLRPDHFRCFPVALWNKLPHDLLHVLLRHAFL